MQFTLFEIVGMVALVAFVGWHLIKIFTPI